MSTDELGRRIVEELTPDLLLRFSAAEPLGHALKPGAWHGIEGRSNREAICGASVGVMTDKQFDPKHPRACRKCVKKA